MKIQITQTKKVDDALCVWPDKNEDTDLMLDPRPPHGLTFKPGSIEIIYAFDICGMTAPEDLPEMIKSFFELLSPKGQLYIIEHDFDYIARSYLGGDLPLAEFNQEFRRISYLNKDTLVKLLLDAGFKEKNLRQWYEGIKFKKSHFEMIISGEK